MSEWFFYKRLRFYRQERGWSQNELAGRAGITQSQVNRLESGESKNPSFDTIERLAGALGVKVSQLADVATTLRLADEERDLMELVQALRVRDKRGFLHDVASLPIRGQETIEDLSRSMAADAIKRATEPPSPELPVQYVKILGNPTRAAHDAPTRPQPQIKPKPKRDPPTDD